MLRNHDSKLRGAVLTASMLTIGAGIVGAATLTYDATAAPTQKVVQVSGPCDWPAWDPKTPPTRSHPYGTPGRCNPTAASRGAANEILAHGFGYSFEASNGNLMFLFGDTVGVQSGKILSPNPNAWQSNPNYAQFLQFNAKDTIAVTDSSLSPNPQSLTIDFLTDPMVNNPENPQFVTVTIDPSNSPPQCAADSCLGPQPNGDQPSYIPNGAPVRMAADEIANAGIYLSGSVNGTSDHIFLIVNTNANAGQPNPQANAYSVLVSFDGNHTFRTGRTISQTNYPQPPQAMALAPPGHFVFTTLYELPLALSQKLLGLNEPAVLIYGTGQYRQSSLYLAYIPESEFWTGVDHTGNSATHYFKGFDKKGNPQWSTSEFEAYPVVWDSPPAFQPASPDPGTIGNASIYYDANNTGLWLMVYDGGRQPDASGHKNEATTGFYFTYSTTPWGPWLGANGNPQQRQMIYNACDAIGNHMGYGDLVNYFYDPTNPNSYNGCPQALQYAGKSFPDKTCASTSAQFTGPAGPVIGTGLDPFGCGAFAGSGGGFAPQIIGRFTTKSPDGKTLKIFYNLSTWNPYTVVEMETDFQIQ